MRMQSKRTITVPELGGITIPYNVSLTAYCLIALRKVLDMNMVTGAAQVRVGHLCFGVYACSYGVRAYIR